MTHIIFLKKVLLSKLLLTSTLLMVASQVLFVPAVFAQDCKDSQFGCFEVGLGENSGATTTTTIDSFADKGLVGYFNILAQVIIALTIGAGLITVVAAGYVYMTAGGDGGKVELAKEMIRAALFGIMLALSAFLILNTISPQFASEVRDPFPAAAP